MALDLHGGAVGIRHLLTYPSTLAMLRFPPHFWLMSAALLFALIILAIAMWFAPQVLTIDSGEVKADALVVLGGGMDERPQRAAELFKEGVAPKIVVSGAGDSELTIRSLEKAGVPAAAIIEEGNSRNTLENAKFSIALLRQMNARRVIIVTSWFHSRRALACFEHFAPDIQFYSRPSYQGYQRREWNRYRIFDCALQEYLKLPGYWVCYGVSPFG